MKVLAWANLLYSLASGVLSVTVIAVIRSELWFSSGVWWNGWWYTSSSSVCYMTTGEVSANICTYGYWVGAVGIFCAFFLFFTGFTKLRPGYRTRRVFEVLLVGFGIVWWLPFAITATVYGKQANNVDLPYKHWRNVVIGLAWSIFIIYTVQLVVVLLDWKTYPKQPEMPHVPPPAPYESQPPPYNTGYPPAGGYGAPPPQYNNYNAAYQQPYYSQGPPGSYQGQTVTGYPQNPNQQGPVV